MVLELAPIILAMGSGRGAGARIIFGEPACIFKQAVHGSWKPHGDQQKCDDCSNLFHKYIIPDSPGHRKV
jgi:hypothetical protein